MIFRERTKFRVIEIGKFAGVEFTSIIISTIAFYFAFSMIPIIRQKFGRRSFQLGNVIFILIGITLLGFLSDYFVVIFWAFLISLAYHFYVVRQRVKNGENWYSRSLGDSYLMNTPLGLKFSENIIHRFVEPAILLLLGYFTYSFINPFLGGYFAVCGLGIAIIESHVENQYKHSLLDQIDNDILSKFYNEQLKEALKDPEKKVKDSEQGVRNPHNNKVSADLIKFFAEKKEREESDDDDIFI